MASTTPSLHQNTQCPFHEAMTSFQMETMQRCVCPPILLSYDAMFKRKASSKHMVQPASCTAAAGAAVETHSCISASPACQAPSLHDHAWLEGVAHVRCTCRSPLMPWEHWPPSPLPVRHMLNPCCSSCSQDAARPAEPALQPPDVLWLPCDVLLWCAVTTVITPEIQATVRDPPVQEFYKVRLHELALRCIQAAQVWQPPPPCAPGLAACSKQ